MKRELISLVVLVSILPQMANSQTADKNPPYVIVANADGTLSMVDGDYPSKVAMSEIGDGVYETKGLKIVNGFVFLGEAADASSVNSLYTMPGWAVSPVLLTFDNPLAISMSSESLIEVAPGTYDITFYDRDVTKDGYHMFKMVASDASTTVVYPPSMYLISGVSAQAIEIPGADGVYEADVTLPSSFRVAYEPRYGIGRFVYGPATASENLLSNGVELPLAYMDNVDVNIGCAPSDGTGNALEGGKECHLKIDIREGNESIMAQIGGTSGIEDVTGDDQALMVSVVGGVISVDGAAGCVKEVYTADGMPVYRGNADAMGPYPNGLYLLRVGDAVRKVVVR